MNISSLLCADDGPQQLQRPSLSPPTASHSPPSRQSPPAPEPVILAPHLRGPHSHYSQQRVQEHSPVLPVHDGRDRVQEHLPLSKQHLRKRSFSPDAREPASLSSSRRSVHADREDVVMEPPRSSHSGHSGVNYAYGLPQQQQQRQTSMETSPFTYGQRPNQPRPQPETVYPSRSPSSRSPTGPQFPSAQSGLPSSLSLISPSYSPPFPREGPSPTPVSAHRGPGSPMPTYFPRPTPPQQQSHRPPSSTHSHSHSPVQHQQQQPTPFTYAPVSQPPPVRPTANPTPPYAHSSSSTSRSPVISKQQSPYMGLEALVHAASQEQRRLSGGRQEGPSEERRTSRSPVVERASGYTTPVSPNRPQYHLEERRMGYGHETPEVRQPQGDHEQRRSTLVPMDGVEPRPIKRQRVSDSSSGSTPAEERERSFAAHYGQGSNGQPLPMRLSGPGAHAYPVNDRAILGIGIDTIDSSRLMQEEKVAPRKTSASSAGKSGNFRPLPQDKPVKVLDRAPSVETKDVEMKESSRPETPRVTEPPQQVKSTQTKEQLPLKEQAPQSKEPDAHEWLMEHYAGNSPSPSATATASRAAPPPRATTQERRSQSASAPRHSVERKHSRTPAPEIAAALERELEEVVAPSKRAIDMDPDVVLDLVANSLDADETTKSSRVSMEVDDELLSLVTDPAPVPAPRQFAAPPPSLRLSKPLTPTIITVQSPAFASAPDSPFHPAPTLDRSSMPPPPTANVNSKGGAAKKGDHTEGAGKGKKSTAPKTAPKAKQPAKPRAKAASKAKPKAGMEESSPIPTNKGTKPSPMPASAIKKSSAAATAGASRSRSTSAMPGGSAAPESETKAKPDKEVEMEVEEDEDKEDDKLYCVCKTRYDEDRVMIACDRCDEWYHTQCVNMPDLEVDLVDQFICPPCVESNPQLNLRTTYRKRCHRGLHHLHPSSPDACHKAARGDYSKYCSDQCGIEFMKTKISTWAKKGGNKDKLWESVRNAEKREGVVVCADSLQDMKGASKMNMDSDFKSILKTNKARVERDAERLNAQLDEVMNAREKLKKEMDVVLWRERLVELATERSEKLDECAWDQRLCFGDEEYAEFGAEVLASYEDGAEKEEAQDAMQVDNGAAEEGEWWCRGKKKCERHAGWQKLRAAEVEFEKDTKDTALLKLTTREREIRKRIEDILDPQARIPPPSSPVKASNGKPSMNGHTKAHSNGDIKKGKKKRV